MNRCLRCHNEDSILSSCIGVNISCNICNCNVYDFLCIDCFMYLFPNINWYDGSEFILNEGMQYVCYGCKRDEKIGDLLGE